MPGPLEGIRVVEVASWVMAPTAGAVLAQWGADVIKVEHPLRADPSRNLRHRALVENKAPINVSFHHANRNKRGVGIDVGTEEGHELLMKLLDRADVFLTNFLPPVRQHLRIDVEHVQARNPRVVYARASAVGPNGDERDRGGYDYATFWCRSGIAAALQTRDLDYPPVMASGSMGDFTTGAFLAGAISAALLQRERGGPAEVVDVSLLATGAWIMAMNVTAAAGGHPVYLRSQLDRSEPTNPLVNVFRTKDDRYLVLCLLQTDWSWPELCERIERPDLLADERFTGLANLQANSTALTILLDDVFAEHTLADWQRRLEGMRGVWDVVQNVAELAHDPQVLANGYVQTLVGASEHPGAPSHVVSPPAQFGGTNPAAVVGPELGQHTEEVLQELGLDWDAIVALKDRMVIT